MAQIDIDHTGTDDLIARMKKRQPPLPRPSLPDYKSEVLNLPTPGDFPTFDAGAPGAPEPAAGAPPAFDRSRVPEGIPVDWAEDFIRRNPGDYHRIASAYGPSSQAVADAQSGRSYNHGAPPFQFDDPYTRRLEDIINQQLKALEQPQSNSQLDKLLALIEKEFTKRSETPGFSPDELALLRTQTLDPIERDRVAGSRRVLERTAMRGMLPSSGLHEADLQEMVDRPADDRRALVQRELGVDAINRSREDIMQAIALGQLGGVSIPGMQRSEDQQRRSEALSLASMLYDLPNRALQENLAVLNGTASPQSLFGQAIQLQSARQQQQMLNAQKWAQLGQLLSMLDF